MRPCLFCLSPKSTFQESKSERPTHEARTLRGLAEDHKRFCEDGARLTRAKEFNNVIRPALLPVPIEDVCIPALHLDLGIYPWMFEAMLADLRSLDLLLAQQLGSLGTTSSDSAVFTNIANISTELANKTEQQRETQAEMNLLQSQVNRV